MAYIPALRFSWLTRYYDPVVQATTRETTFKRHLVDEAGLEAGHRVLDLGCGTGTLAINIKRRYPNVVVSGLDGDPKILDIASKKAVEAGVDIVLETGMSHRLPFPDGSFDRIFSTLFFHHLTHEDKMRTLGEVYRTLTPGGKLCVGDWGKAQNLLMRVLFLPVQILDGFETTTDNVNGLLPGLICKAGFAPVREIKNYATMFGTISLHEAMKPAI